MKRTALTPLGTARERLLVSLGAEPHYTLASAAGLREFNLGEEAAYLAWEIVRCVSGLPPLEERALFFLVLASVVNLHQGSTRLPVRGTGVGYLARLLEKLGGLEAFPRVPELLADPRLEPVLGRPGDYRPLILDGDYLYHQRILHFEVRLGRALNQRLMAPSLPIDLALAQRALEEVAGGRLSAEQQYAVLTAVCSHLTVITGGPGTGKTSIVVAILRVLARLGLPMSLVALAAPTGKAAYRMKVSIAASLAALDRPSPEDRQVASVPEPRTLHRLLGYSPATDRFRYHALHRLPEEVIIVDECSMIDLHLMDRLVHAVREEARLVLLGDAEQLPSVEAGAVFRSLVPPGSGSGASPWRALLQPEFHEALPPPVVAKDPRWKAAVRLSRSYRMDASRPEGRRILLVAGRINAGHADALFQEEGEGEDGDFIRLCHAPEEVSFRGVDLLDAPGQLGAFLDLWLQRHVLSLQDFASRVKRPVPLQEGRIQEASRPQVEELFDHYERAKILCVTRAEVEGTGADAINAHLHAGLGRALGLVVGDLCPGAPVMMLHNDYERELFNGDQGIVLQVSDDEGTRLAAVFRRSAGHFGVFRLDSLRSQLQLAFAMTVHKAQGSEFDHVALVLPGANMPLLTREVLYTAVTRSKTSVVIVGQRVLLEVGVRQPIERFSGLAERLVDISLPWERRA
ncbi:MAG: exodeoxyribonuclease V subunit alpha [Myxococcales bacterium]|nr:exodeoxyribonuclease V subunit alpha [Polyangiaceae bacterium]MDW8248545.1 exodeoxyribonuclease V subunit alpha [Myxococcales bacterium]